MANGATISEPLCVPESVAGGGFAEVITTADTTGATAARISPSGTVGTDRRETSKATNRPQVTATYAESGATEATTVATKRSRADNAGAAAGFRAVRRATKSPIKTGAVARSSQKDGTKKGAPCTAPPPNPIATPATTVLCSEEGGGITAAGGAVAELEISFSVAFTAFAFVARDVFREATRWGL